MKKSQISISVCLAMALFSNQSHAFLVGTTTYPCALGVCSQTNTVLFPYDLPSVVAAEHSASLVSSQNSDWDWKSRDTSPSQIEYMISNLFVVFTSPPQLEYYLGAGIHIFLEPDGNTFDEFTDDIYITY